MSSRRRPFGMRPSSLLLGSLLLGLAVAPVPQPPAAASCVGPSIDVAEGQVFKRGATLTVTGEVFVDGCQDFGSCSVGGACQDQSCDYGPEPKPMEDVTLRLVQDGGRWNLGTTDAGESGDDEGRVSWTFEVPADARPGRAQLVADEILPVQIRVR